MLNDALEVDVHDQVPVLLGHLEEQVVAGDAGVVDQDVDPAELVDDALHRGLRGGGVDDVAADADRAGTVGEVEAARGVGGGGLVEVEDRDRGALAGEALGDAEADASGCSGDDGDAAVEPTHGELLGVCGRSGDRSSPRLVATVGRWVGGSSAPLRSSLR